MVRDMAWWPWRGRSGGGEAEAMPTAREIVGAVQAVQADVRRLGAASVRAEGRLDGLSGQLAAGLEQLSRQVGNLAGAQEAAAQERARVLTRFFDLGDALARALGALEQEVAAPADPEAVAAPPAQPLAVLAETLGRLRAQFLRTVGEFGCEAVAAPGDPFDPRVHRAVARVERAEGVGRVALVARDGWRLDGRLLRAADVVVTVAPTPGGRATGSEPAAG